MLVFPLFKRKVFKVLFTPESSKQDLCSNLCLTPVSSMAEDPPDPVERWIPGACATWPRPKDAPDVQATLLYAGLTLTGVMQLRDFEGLNSTEAIAIWPHLK